MSAGPQPSVHVRAGDEPGCPCMGNVPGPGLVEYPHRHGMSQQACDHLVSQACLFGELCKRYASS